MFISLQQQQQLQQLQDLQRKLKEQKELSAPAAQAAPPPALFDSNMMSQIQALTHQLTELTNQAAKANAQNRAQSTGPGAAVTSAPPVMSSAPMQAMAPSVVSSVPPTSVHDSNRGGQVGFNKVSVNT